MSKLNNNNPHFFCGYITITFPESNPHIIKAHSQDFNRMFNWLHNEAVKFCDGSALPVESVNFESIDLKDMSESGIYKKDLTHQFIKSESIIKEFKCYAEK